MLSIHLVGGIGGRFAQFTMYIDALYICIYAWCGVCMRNMENCRNIGIFWYSVEEICTNAVVDCAVYGVR